MVSQDKRRGRRGASSAGFLLAALLASAAQAATVANTATLQHDLGTQAVTRNSNPVTGDGYISVDTNHQLLVHYEDSFYPADVVDDSALVDPFGFVFDSQTGAPIDGATVTVIDLATGQPAVVFGDDGFSAYPAAVTTGGTVTDSGGQVYKLPPGGYRFPFMAPGNYQFVVTPPPGYTMPSTRTPADLNADPDTTGYQIVAGSYGDPFVVLPGPALHIDVPVDPPADPSQTLSLRKSVSRTEASAGDYLQYTLLLSNRDTANPANNVVIADTLPAGLRYQAGSLRVAGAATGVAISPDGRTLNIPVGNLPAAGSVSVSYVVEVVTGQAQREAINRAEATADGGVRSNVARAAVRIREPLMSAAFTLVGEVSCNAPVPVPVAPVTAACPAPEGLTPIPSTTYTVQANFDSGKASLKRQGETDLDQLAATLQRRDIERIELVGHTDSQRVGNPETLRKFKDNYGLSRARAQTVGEYLAGKLGLRPEQVSASGQGPDAPVAGNDSPEGMAKNRRTEVRVFERQADAAAAPACAATAAGPAVIAGRRGIPQVRVLLEDGTYTTTDVDGRYHFEGVRPGTHVVQLDLDSLPPGYRVLPRIQNTRFAGRSYSQFVDVRGGGLWRADFEVCSQGAEAGTPVPDEFAARTKAREAVEDDATAASGVVVQTLVRGVHFAGAPVRAELVEAESVLVADGIHRPVVAVRLFDRDGNPVRAGMTGTYAVNSPHQPWESIERQQQRQLAGRERAPPVYRIEGDQGIAYIELAPTTDSGTAVLTFNFRDGGGHFRSAPARSRRDDIRVWLQSPPRDWLLVGFVDGTVGYNTLKDNASALPPGTEDEIYTDGQASVYAKGRVLGQWLLTLAYDSGKPGEIERRRSLLSTIDPNEYYTLYGDGSGQRYDAPSQDKLYLKLERGQFYALFGDYDTGLNVTQLSRYSRTLNGFKTEYGGGPVTLTAFAADTAQNFARDEIRGNGTSGLYRLSRSPLVLNSEHIRIETRDRYRAERVVQSRALVRHIDYDIDYSAATLFFKQPVPNRDTDFNPIFIVAEYETFGAGDAEVNAGGRLGIKAFGDRLQAGVSGIHDRRLGSAGDLLGADLTLRVGEASEFRMEAAQSNGEKSSLAREGDAWLAEYEHHGERLNGVLYTRRQEAGFGLDQQSASEAGTQKTGADGQFEITRELSLLGQAYRQENLTSDATREVGSAGLQYRTDLSTLRAGYQTAKDDAGSGQRFESEQLNFGAGRYLFDKRLELQANGDVGLSDRNANADFPSRYQLGASYAVTPETRLIAAQEYTDGDAFDTNLTRVGLQMAPWSGGRLDTTLNQQQISEYGPRTFAQFGLSQALLVGERWGADLSLDSSRTFDESGQPPYIFNPNQPSTVTGGSYTEDYVAVSGGLTYRAELWSWNGRAESRDGSSSDRYGLSTNFLRQARAGVAFAANLQGFLQKQEGGAEGRYGTAGLAWAWRPLGSRWALLDRFEFRFDQLDRGSGAADGIGSALFGNTSLNVTGDAISRRWVNNFALNRVSDEWTEDDRRGNLFTLHQRNQWSLYYGAKYSFDKFDGVDYSGYTDLLGLEWRYDMTRHWDIGVQASSLNSWSNHTHDYSAGPSIGWSPVVNGWLSVGYNLVGFYDRDFEAARYTAQGPYLKLRFKFDQNTRFGLDRKDPRAMAWDEHAAAPENRAAEAGN